MTVEDDKTKIIMFMHDQEKLVAELYSLFAEKFPEDRDLWIRLSQAEVEHAESIRTLYKIVYERNLVFDEGSTTLRTVQSVMEWTKEMIENTKRGKLSRLKALSIAKSLENSLLEKKWFYFFKDTSGQFKSIMERLKDETANHAALVEERLQTVQRS